MSINIQ